MHTGLLGEAPINGRPESIRLKAHVSDERYANHRDPLVDLVEPTGTRAYVHAKPFLLLPDVTLAVGLFPTPDPSGTIGELVDSRVTGFRHLEIGQAQAWYYPTERALVLWECFLEAPYRGGDPCADPVHRLVWGGFERFLLGRFPQATRLLTTFEPAYDRETFARFLASQRYARVGPVAFARELTANGGS